MSSGVKRNHHVLPRLYLKGFVEEIGKPFIWVYTRGKRYKPGKARGGKYNPYRDSINFAGVERDAYALTKESGEVDFEKYENILEGQEKPADAILQKIRGRQPITDEEKSVFSGYIIMMDKRVPRRKEKAEKSWPSTVQKVREEILKAEFTSDRLDPADPENVKKIERYREKMLAVLAQRETEIPDEILLETMIAPSAVEPVIRAMHWQFLVAPKGFRFITADNPVFYDEVAGLNKPYSEITFPISTDVALAASWRHDLIGGFVSTSEEIVLEINRRTVFCASKNVYSSRKSSWLVRMFNKNEYKLGPIY